MQPTEKRGVSTAMHYKTLRPDNFAPPLLHMEMGLVNQVWENFESWVDDHVEMIPIDEKAVRLAVVDAKVKVDRAADEKETAKRTIGVEIRQNKAEIIRLKCELQRTGITIDIRQEFNARTALLTAIVKEKQSIEKRIQETFKVAQETLKQSKKRLEELKTARGKPHSSIAANVKLTLAKFLISRTSYHGGDFNGVCCWRLVHSARDIIQEIKPVLVQKKEDSCEERSIDKKIETVENTLGLVEAAFSYLYLFYATEDEKKSPTSCKYSHALLEK